MSETTWIKTSAGHYTRPDGLTIQRHGRGEWLIHNSYGLIARRPSIHGGYSESAAFAPTFDQAKSVAAEVAPDAPAFHSIHCPVNCPGHVKTWRGRLVTNQLNGGTTE